jgi:TRAP-type transport system periplasmic protein
MPLTFGSDSQSATQLRGVGRRTVMLGGLSIPAVLRGARAGAAFSWRIGHSAPADFPLHVHLTQAAGVVNAKSQGQMDIKLHPNNELGGPIGMLSQLRAGTIDGALLSSQSLAADMPLASLPNTGFAFSGYDALWPAIDGDLGGLLRQSAKDRLALEIPVRCWDFGFRQVTTSGRQIQKAADIAGVRLRTPPDADLVGLFQSLKALPVGMPLQSTEIALRTKAIDGQESLIQLLKAGRFYLVQSRCALTNHVWDGYWLCVSGRSWSRLPQTLQDIFTDSFNQAAINQRKATLASDAALRSELEGFGITFNAVDVESFRRMLSDAGYYKAWRGKIGDTGWDKLEKYAGRLV